MYIVRVSEKSETIVRKKPRIWKSIMTENDVHLLQEDIDKVYNWARENNMQFNNNKFEVFD